MLGDEGSESFDGVFEVRLAQGRSSMASPGYMVRSHWICEECRFHTNKGGVVRLVAEISSIWIRQYCIFRVHGKTYDFLGLVQLRSEGLIVAKNPGGLRSFKIWQVSFPRSSPVGS